MTPMEADVPPLTKFMVTVHMLNTVFSRTIRDVRQVGRFTFWYAIHALVLWTWVLLVVLPELREWLGV
jgi:hypothetical protein